MPELKRVTLNGLVVRCEHCGNSAFTPRKWQLTPPPTSCLSFDSLNEAADVFVCTKCGKLHWFLLKDRPAPDCIIADWEEGCEPECGGIESAPSPVQLIVEAKEERAADPMQPASDAPSDPDLAELDENYDVECMQCGHMIPAGQSTCTKCGWTYKE
jgi:ribosomal protein L37E